MCWEFWTTLMIRLKCLKKARDVQSSLLGDIICSKEAGTCIGLWEAWGWEWRNWAVRFLDRLSAATLSTPGICTAKMLISKKAKKNHRHRSKCITMGSFEEPLLIALTRLLLSNWNCSDFLVKKGPQIAQINTIGTNSFTIMSILVHSADHWSWIQWLLNSAPQPQDPDASVWIKVSGFEGASRKLTPFQWHMNKCHHLKNQSRSHTIVG